MKRGEYYVPFLIRQAEEIATEGHNGWGNTMIMAAEEIERLRARIKRLEVALRFYDGGDIARAALEEDK